MKYLVILSELLISSAIAENFIFWGEKETLFFAALTVSFLVAIFSLAKRKYYRPTAIQPFFVALMLALQAAISVSYYWQDRLDNFKLQLDPTCIIASATILLLAISDLSGTRRRVYSYYLKLVIYLLTFSFSLWEICPVIQAISFHRVPEIHTLLVLSLPLLLMLPALVGKFLQWNAAGASALATASVSLACCVLATGFFEAVAKNYSKLPTATPQNTQTYRENFLVPLLVSEDPIFFDHHGVDFSRIQEALNEAFTTGSLKRGGSTITMQLFKVLTGEDQKTIWRKLVQMFGAIILEFRYSKREILDAYQADIPLGNEIVGVDAAAHYYFQQEPAALSDSQALQIVLSIYDPANFNPSMRTMPRTVQLRAAVIESREDSEKKYLRQMLYSRPQQ